MRDLALYAHTWYAHDCNKDKKANNAWLARFAAGLRSWKDSVSVKKHICHAVHILKYSATGTSHAGDAGPSSSAAATSLHAVLQARPLQPFSSVQYSIMQSIMSGLAAGWLSGALTLVVLLYRRQGPGG